MDPIAIAGLVALLFVKEAGLPVPVPGDLLVVGAGAALASQAPAAAVVLLLILVAGWVGGSAQFLLMRGAVRRPLLGLLSRVGVGPERLEPLADRLRRGGARGVAIARATPGVRIGAIAASGLAGLPTATFVRGLVVGNSVFVVPHFGLGFVLGASAEAFARGIAGAALPVLGLVLLLAVVGAVGWAILARRRRRATAIGGLGAWTDAACPACLAVVALDARGAAPAGLRGRRTG